MSATPVRRRVDALLKLAAGSSNRAAAEAAGVSPGTIAEWKKRPAFARELAALQTVMRRRPVDAEAVVAAVEAAAIRLSPPKPQVAVDGSVTVRVSIPAGTSPRQRQKLTARAIARGLAAMERGQS